MHHLSRRALLAYGSAALLSACAGQRRVRPRSTLMTPGAGTFTLPGGPGHEQHLITVHYFLPQDFDERTPILLVLPGAGRNGDDYRDAWIPMATEKRVIVAAPSYAESDYDNAAYQMCGVIRNLRTGPPLPGSSDTVRYLRDEDIRFDLVTDRAQWLVNDFDRLFDVIKSAVGSGQSGYDMFGHSAGGQILHRHVLLHPGSRARRVIAANAGFYSLPDLTTPPVTGLAGLGIDEASLRRSFAAQLLVLLGENDNDPERGGSHLHTPLIDQQGTNRLARGRYFHAFAAERAQALGAQFAWELRVAPGIGHDFRAITPVAANLLYG